MLPCFTQSHVTTRHLNLSDHMHIKCLALHLGTLGGKNIGWRGTCRGTCSAACHRAPQRCSGHHSGGPCVLEQRWGPHGLSILSTASKVHTRAKSRHPVTLPEFSVKPGDLAQGAFNTHISDAYAPLNDACMHGLHIMKD